METKQLNNKLLFSNFLKIFSIETFAFFLNYFICTYIVLFVTEKKPLLTNMWKLNQTFFAMKMPCNAMVSNEKGYFWNWETSSGYNKLDISGGLGCSGTGRHKKGLTWKLFNLFKLHLGLDKLGLSLTFTNYCLKQPGLFIHNLVFLSKY